MAKFLDVFEDVTKLGTKVPTDEYLDNGDYPIIDQGQAYISGYRNDDTGLFTDIPVIIFGDHTRVLKYVNMPCFLGADGVKLLKSKDETADYKYLYYALSNAKIPNTGYNRHFKWLKEVEIPMPDVKTQKQIAANLDKVTHTIDLCNNILEKLDLLVKARFVEMFGDPVYNTKKLPMKRLAELGSLDRGRSQHRPRNAPELLGGPYPLIQTGEVANAGLYITGYSNTYSELGLKQSKMWKAGTLCITIAANIAQTSILTFDACFPDSVVGFIPGDSIGTIYMHYWFGFFQKILEEQAPQVAQKNINLKILSDLSVVVPNQEQQKDFIAFVEQTDKSKSAVKQVLEKAETLKKALMQEYFG